MPVPQKVKLARHPADLDDDGHEIVEFGVTAETDTDLRLAPDGAGGVEWSTGGGVGGLHWEPMFTGTGLIMADGLGNMMRHEVAY